MVLSQSGKSWSSSSMIILLGIFRRRRRRKKRNPFRTTRLFSLSLKKLDERGRLDEVCLLNNCLILDTIDEMTASCLSSQTNDFLFCIFTALVNPHSEYQQFCRQIFKLRSMSPLSLKWCFRKMLIFRGMVVCCAVQSLLL